MENNTSPLKKFKRQPKLYIDLPSQGRWYSPGNVSKTTELPVYSMTASDEVLLKTPDALLNGSATVKIIQDCVPDIKNAWEVTIADLYTLLTAIRIASYGEEYTIKGVCPKCSNADDYSVKLNFIIDRLANASIKEQLYIDELELDIRPLSYKEFTEINGNVFRQQRHLLQSVQKMEDGPDKEKEIQKSYDALARLQVEAVTKTVRSITVDNEVENDLIEIIDFIKNSDKKYYNELSKTVVNNNQSFSIPETDVKCSSCETEYKTSLELDYTNFFVNS